MFVLGISKWVTNFFFKKTFGFFEKTERCDFFGAEEFLVGIILQYPIIRTKFEGYNSDERVIFSQLALLGLTRTPTSSFSLIFSSGNVLFVSEKF